MGAGGGCQPWQRESGKALPSGKGERRAGARPFFTPAPGGERAVWVWGEGYGVRPRAADPRVTHAKQQVTAPNQLCYQEGRQIWQRRCLCQERQAPLAETVALLPPLRTPERIHLTPWAFGRALIRL